MKRNRENYDPTKTKLHRFGFGNSINFCRKRRLRENLTWLEGQQATINQQVKLGGELVKGGGSSLTKRARVGRGF